MAALEALAAAANVQTDTSIVAQTDTMLVPRADIRPEERVAPSRIKWRSWLLHVDAYGIDDNMSAIRSGLLSETGSAPSPPVALVYIHKVASAAPTRMVDSLVVLYAGQGRRVSTVSRTWAGVKAKLQLAGRTGGRQARKPEPMSIQGLAHFLASQPEQDWSCTCLADDVGDDKARFQQYLELVSATSALAHPTSLSSAFPPNHAPLYQPYVPPFAGGRPLLAQGQRRVDRGLLRSFSPSLSLCW